MCYFMHSAINIAHPLKGTASPRKHCNSFLPTLMHALQGKAKILNRSPLGLAQTHFRKELSIRDLNFVK